MQAFWSCKTRFRREKNRRSSVGSVDQFSHSTTGLTYPFHRSRRQNLEVHSTLQNGFSKSGTANSVQNTRMLSFTRRTAFTSRPKTKPRGDEFTFYALLCCQKSRKHTIRKCSRLSGYYGQTLFVFVSGLVISCGKPLFLTESDYLDDKTRNSRNRSKNPQE